MIEILITSVAKQDNVVPYDSSNIFRLSTIRRESVKHANSANNLLIPSLPPDADEPLIHPCITDYRSGPVGHQIWCQA